MYNSDKDPPENHIARYSLLNATISTSVKKDGRFDIRVVPNQVVSFEAKDEKEKEEWISVVKRILLSESLKL